MHLFAPTAYRGLAIHIDENGPTFFVNTPTGKIQADSWLELKEKIDAIRD